MISAEQEARRIYNEHDKYFDARLPSQAEIEAAAMRLKGVKKPIQPTYTDDPFSGVSDTYSSISDEDVEVVTTALCNLISDVVENATEELGLVMTDDGEAALAMILWEMLM